MSAPPPWLRPVPGTDNSTVPPSHWGMTISQLHGFIACCQTTSTWAGLLDSSHESSTRPTTINGSRASTISVYQLVQHFVVPWTAGTRTGVALQLNGAEPLAASLMISHAWGESCDEAALALGVYCEQNSVWEGTSCWFCALALYQPGDGPTIAEQVAMDPFGTVISSIKLSGGLGMMVIHTSTAELYERLWCNSGSVHAAVLGGHASVVVTQLSVVSTGSVS
eukprot:TRINITY_DN12793_c0_g1_i1.p1 TRINITY_DN12793_c0_g1~~TRINITY_DN12793_c0_g1_i1.p1  ORF type:complete len:223 (+),score=36.66 TRINITY_DN12793_c0_g1_i1:53-721(+)